MSDETAQRAHLDAIDTRQYLRALEDLRDFANVATLGREGRLASVIAPSGCGKSTLIQSFQKQMSDEALKRGEHSPLLRVKVPPKPALRSFYESLLKALGAPCVPRDTNEDRRVRILGFLKKLGIRIVVLDEFQHLAKTHGLDQMGVCDVIKSLMNDGRVGIIIVGILEAEVILEQDEQILRRRYSAIRLFPFCDPQSPELGNEEAMDAEFGEFKAVMKHYAESFGCPDADYILQHNVATRILDLSRGVFGRLVNFIEAACHHAKERSSSGIDEEAIQATVRRQGLTPGESLPPLVGDQPKSKRAQRKMPKDERRLRASMGQFRSDKLEEMA